MERRKTHDELVERWRKLEEELVDSGLSVSAARDRIGKAYGVSRITVRRYVVEGESGCGIRRFNSRLQTASYGASPLVQSELSEASG